MAVKTVAGSASGTRALAERFDVIIVGARCAGSPLATLLAGAGLRVCVVDRARFPSDTASTHGVQPSGVRILDRLASIRRYRRDGDGDPGREE